MRTPTRLSVVVGLALAVALLAGACGGDEPSSSPSSEPAPSSASVEEGRDLVAELGCSGCHSIDGSEMTGPTWKGLAGSEVTLTDGTVVEADRDYLARSITDPTAEVVEGFDPVMPDLGLDEDQVEAIVDYIESLS